MAFIMLQDEIQYNFRMTNAHIHSATNYLPIALQNRVQTQATLPDQMTLNLAEEAVEEETRIMESNTH